MGASLLALAKLYIISLRLKEKFRLIPTLASENKDQSRQNRAKKKNDR